MWFKLINVFYFITEKIKMASKQQETETNCPYCREVLRLSPSDYPVCRMAADFQRELDKLDVAVKNSKHNGNDLVISLSNNQLGLLFMLLPLVIDINIDNVINLIQIG